jgi:hypothetical protein
LACPRSRFHPSVPVHAGHQTAATRTLRCSPPARNLSWVSSASTRCHGKLLLTALLHGRHRRPFKGPQRAAAILQVGVTGGFAPPNLTCVGHINPASSSCCPQALPCPAPPP